MVRARAFAAALTVSLLVPTVAAASAPPAASWSVHGGVGIVTVTDAPPGIGLDLTDATGELVARGRVDLAGSLVFRDLDPGEYTLAGAPVTVGAIDDHPDPALYTDQHLEAGVGYIETRDGTTLSTFVSLPGDPAAGPYPTVVEYSGYQPSHPDDNPFAQLFNALGYAYVGVNMRGTGCSGGSFYYFDDAQVADGYDAIETVAAQSWVANATVGMVGVSYPGISQLFVAQSQPPSLAAITPFSVIDDSYRAVLYPGGILNTGFGVEWLQERLDDNVPFGQDWVAERAAAGDTICAANQRVRLQNPNLVEMIRSNDTYVAAEYDRVAPRRFVDEITVPTMVSGAWQDEQTGARFATMLDEFTGTEHFYATVGNGLHTESIGAASFVRLVEFLDLYVARRVPTLDGARSVVPILADEIFGTGEVTIPLDDRFAGMTYDDALAAFEAEPPVALLLESGAADGELPGAPIPRTTVGLDAWPAPQTVARTWFLGDGTLSADSPVGAADPVSYRADPNAVPANFFDPTADSDGDGSDDNVWAYDVDFDWVEPPADTVASFVSEPFSADTILTGSGSVDLWIRTNALDTDIEVTISELRPDGSEVMIQSGWLRPSHRALDTDASTALQPVHTHAAADISSLPPGEWTPVRIAVLPFAHPVRAGSQLRLTVDAPGGNRPVWEFATLSRGERIEIAIDDEHPSALVLGTLDPATLGVDLPAEPPGCTLRGQPCREPGVASE